MNVTRHASYFSFKMTTLSIAVALASPLALQVGGLSDIRPGSGRRVSFARGFCHLFDAAGRSIGLRKHPEALKAAGQGLAASA